MPVDTVSSLSVLLALNVMLLVFYFQLQSSVVAWIFSYKGLVMLESDFFYLQPYCFCILYVMTYRQMLQKFCNFLMFCTSHISILTNTAYNCVCWSEVQILVIRLESTRVIYMPRKWFSHKITNLFVFPWWL